METAAIPALHTDVLVTKDEVTKLGAEQQRRDNAVLAIKNDTALMPALHSHVLSIRDGMSKVYDKESGASDAGSQFHVHADHSVVIAKQEKREKVLAWISKGNGRETYRRKIALRQTGTGDWFLRHKSFEQWLTGGGKTLWCPGIRE